MVYLVKNLVGWQERLFFGFKIYKYYRFTFLTQKIGAFWPFWQVKPLRPMLEEVPYSFKCVLLDTRLKIFISSSVKETGDPETTCQKCRVIIISCFRPKIPRLDLFLLLHIRKLHNTNKDNWVSKRNYILLEKKTRYV